MEKSSVYVESEQEALRYKWIESEKKGEEIGFATAALDWIKRYGVSWQQFRLGLKRSENLLLEKRRHRRFAYHFPIFLMAQNTCLARRTDNISLIGLSCTIPADIPHNTKTEVTIRFVEERLPIPRWRFQFTSRIARIKKLKCSQADSPFQIFIPFDEKVRDYIRANAIYL